MVDQVHKPFLAFILIILFSASGSVFSDCPDIDSTWQSLDISSKLKFLLENSNQVDSSCFISVLEPLIARSRKSHQDSLVLFVKKWGRDHYTSTHSLFLSYHSNLIYSRKPVWSLIFADWQRDNQTLYNEIDSLVNRGMHATADTLLDIFDAEGKLDAQDLLKWAKIKSLTGDYSRIAGLYCRAIGKEPGFSGFAFHQLGRELGDSELSVAEKVLEQFLKCIIDSPGSDTLSIYSWLADIYSKLELYKQELDVFQAMEAAGGSISSRTLDAARKRYSLHKYREAIEAARMSYQSTDRASIRTMAATIAYQSFVKTGDNYSAAKWLARIGLDSDKSRIEAITFYQNSGDFSAASRLIDSLSTSVARDSLVIRQFILKGEIQSTLNFFAKPELPIHKNKESASMWKARMLLFSSKIDEFSAFLDTLEIAPFWQSAGELISYQFWLQQFGNSSEALAVWASIEFNLYRGSFHKISQSLSVNRIEFQQRQKLALYVAKSYIKRGQYNEALVLLNTDPVTEVTPEYLYCKAEALFHCGKVDSARAIFNRIMMEHPADLFSDKARAFVNLRF